MGLMYSEVLNTDKKLFHSFIVKDNLYYPICRYSIRGYLETSSNGIEGLSSVTLDELKKENYEVLTPISLETAILAGFLE